MPPPAALAALVPAGVKVLMRGKAGQFAVFVGRYAVRWLPYYVAKYSLILAMKQVPPARSYRIVCRILVHHVHDAARAATIRDAVKMGYRVPGQLMDVLAIEELGHVLEKISAQPVGGMYVKTSQAKFAVATAAKASRAARSYKELRGEEAGTSGGGGGKINWGKEAKVFCGSILGMAALHAYMHPEEVWEEAQEIEKEIEREVEVVEDALLPSHRRKHEEESKQLEQIQVRLAEIESVRADARLALLALDGRVACVERDIGFDLTEAESCYRYC